jgi:hypothetical protein
MPAWYLTISTPLGEKHTTVRGQDVKTPEDAKAVYKQIQEQKGWKNGIQLGHQGEITDCVPAVWPDHFRGRPSAMDAAYPQPLDRKALLK